MTKMKSLPPLDRLMELLIYEESEGALYWKDRPQSHFKDLGSFKRWQKLKANKPAGHVGVKGYVIIEIDKSCYKAHRVIWLMKTGEEPDSIMDHINHNRSDNRFINLRMASHSDNSKNRSVNCRNKSGCPGVKFYPEYNSWVVSIKVDYKSVHLGNYESKDEAIRVRKEAEVKYGFHRNHGDNYSSYREG